MPSHVILQSSLSTSDSKNTSKVMLHSPGATVTVSAKSIFWQLHVSSFHSSFVCIFSFGGLWLYWGSILKGFS